ncbi:hypothetical protein H7849_11960 [Alloacidobacterium dinghuense]|uniref:BIG2 domain-containing protein n=1 Tax=Alloacidobacterium dinghuense TaxID=2763107 RepID=A0A7G8BPS1_9BACT|nr:Ig-like domain-containing protein [Alloacidobacterium dinghuense]QNI34541.1 hypothetical protein H7849_11960 [Alloacidobacterium dinghuense]
MANSSTTLASSASDTTGTPIPLAYGYAWVTGKRAEYFMLQNTGNKYLDYTRVGIWLLGHGEWDGCNELWINDNLIWRSENDQPTQFHFHRGADSIIGSGMTPSSSGPDQGVESFFQYFPSAINPLHYSRIAYYSIFRKQAIENPQNDHQDDPTQWTDINPIGLWRALRCRLFDANGNQTGYAFTTNPAWHFVDVLLRRKLFPDYALDLNNGPDPLPSAVAARFDWETIYNSAQYFDEILANGRRRFTGNYAFSSQTTLQAVLTQILLCCRSFCSEYAGKIQLICDAPRPSIFTFSRQHVIPGSLEFSDQSLHTAANRYIAQFRDLLIPAAAQIASISCPDHKEPTVTTVLPHPFANADWIAIGGTGTVYDGEWQVDQVPTPADPGIDDVYTFTMHSKGSNYPTSVGEGGYAGLLYSRFKERAPEFWHKTNMLARGALGVGIVRQRNKVKNQLDFATCTFDQAARISTYERDRTLGLDQSPYITPPAGKLRVPLFAKDAFGNLAASIRPGDHVTVDDTLSFTYTGEYEVLEPLTVYPTTVSASSSGDGIRLTPDANSGEIEFNLGPYNEAVFYDTSNQNAAGWLNVPGSDPGNDTSFTGFDLAGGGVGVFFTGALASGGVFQLPSTGFTPSNLLAWAGPQGYIEYGHPMHVIALCDANESTRQLTLTYEDGGENEWPGDVNFAALTWMGSYAPTTSGAMKWLQLTLLGGEIILFGEAIVAGDGSFSIPLPSGFTAAKCFAVAYPHDAVTNGNDAHGVAAFVDPSTLTVHLNYQDGSGNTWHGNAKVLVFAWQNNMGTVTTETDSGVKWMHCTLTNGKVFGVGCGLGMSQGANFALPAIAGDGSTLQAIAGPSGFQIVDHPAHGVGACYLDGNNDVVIMFEDGEGHQWNGTADVFGLFCTSGSATPTVVTVSPSSVTMPAGSVQAFTATVQNNANTSVTWSVDGIAGGNVTVGTIDASGNYSAPVTSGLHTITATSVADTSASGSAKVSVTGAGNSGATQGFIVTED